jgi:hypothetical protein
MVIITSLESGGCLVGIETPSIFEKDALLFKKHAICYS